MARTAKITFTELPQWTLTAKAGVLSFFEAIALADLEGKWIRLSADTQKALLGSNVFGKQEFRVNTDGTVDVSRSTAFGMDSEIAQYDLHAIKRAIERRVRVSPGMQGKGYLDLGAESLIDTVRIAGRDDEAKALAADGKWRELDRMYSGLTGVRGTNWPNMQNAAAILAA
jgi:hypothetical protein